MKKLLTILGSVGMIGTAGATVVACGNKNTATPPTISKGELEAKINEAKTLVEGSKKSEEATKTLSEAIVVAKTVFDKVDATQEEIGNAITVLQTAIDTFNKESDVVNKTALNEKIAEAKTLVEGSKKAEEVIKALNDAIDTAQKVVDDTKATQEQVDGAVTALQAAMDAFTKTPDVVDKTALNDKIAEANGLVEDSTKAEDVTSALRDAIGVAQKVADDKKTTQEQVNTATDDLQTAIDEFKAAE